MQISEEIFDNSHIEDRAALVVVVENSRKTFIVRKSSNSFLLQHASKATVYKSEV